MKSSTNKALASLQHKYRKLIIQHGILRNKLKAEQLHAYKLERREPSLFDEQLLKDNIAELELTIERLEFDLRAATAKGTPNNAYKEDVTRAWASARDAQNRAQKAESDRDDAKQAVWVYSLLSFAVGVLGTYGTLFAYGLVPGIY